MPDVGRNRAGARRRGCRGSRVVPDRCRTGAPDDPVGDGGRPARSERRRRRRCRRPPAPARGRRRRQGPSDVPPTATARRRTRRTRRWCVVGRRRGRRRGSARRRRTGGSARSSVGGAVQSERPSWPEAGTTVRSGSPAWRDDDRARLCPHRVGGAVVVVSPSSADAVGAATSGAHDARRARHSDQRTDMSGAIDRHALSRTPPPPHGSSRRASSSSRRPGTREGWPSCQGTMSTRPARVSFLSQGDESGGLTDEHRPAD